MNATAPIQRVLIVGLGTMGQQIALQCGRFGLEVRLHDVDARAWAACRRRHDEQLDTWARLAVIEPDAADAVRRRIAYFERAEECAAGADLLIECVPEVRRLKAEVFARFDVHCPPHTIFTTNASYLTPSMLVRGLTRSPRFAALHFHDPVWHANVVDIMPHAGTDPAAVEQLVDFARRIDQVPIVCRQERHGYVFNAMLQSFLQTALTLHTSGVASFQDVDRAWMGVMKTPIGPFGILDRIGLDTVHDIASFWTLASRDSQQRRNLELLAEMTAAGRLGVKSGWGFYRYPLPEFERAGFLQGRPAPLASAEPGSSERR